MDKNVITVYDIAKEAKVSPATVSRVLTGSAPVREETKRKVEKIIKKYNFQPNALARSLTKKQSRMIGVILPDITHPFFSTVFMEAERYALQKGYTMILCNSMNDYDVESLHLKTLSEKQVDAVVFMGGRANLVKISKRYADEVKQLAMKIPVVIINGNIAGMDSHNVSSDEEKGVNLIIDHLVGLGHKKIGIIGGVTNITSTDIKYKGFVNALNRHGLQANKKWMITDGFSLDCGYEAMTRLLECKDLPTAVMAINDVVAIGAIKAAKAAGLKVPEDISITGFDDTYISEIVSPQLTTVNQNYKGLGHAAIDTIVGIISGQPVERCKIIDVNIVIRESCSEPYISE